jgi:hypothetical protein
MAIRTYGAIRLDKKEVRWEITQAEPHVCIKLKAIFARLKRTSTMPFHFDRTPENCNDLLWFLDRYPMVISKADHKALLAGRTTYEQTQVALERILMPDCAPVAMYLKEGKEARGYQLRVAQFDKIQKRFLLGDEIGLGKTLSAILTLLGNPTKLPAAVVVQTHLPRQWKEEGVEKFTGLSVHIIEKTKPYSLPPADIYIFKYSTLAGWVDVFGTGFFKSAVFDEIQELRRPQSNKYQAAQVLSGAVEYCLGMSATPVYNMGDEIYAVLNLIKPGCLGDQYDFLREWTIPIGKNKYKVNDPAALGTYLRENYLFLRRTRKDVGRELPMINKIVYTVGYDSKEVERAEDIAKMLAIKVTGGSFVERGQAARELDAYARHITGVSKAREVAAFVRILLESGEPVVLSGWHRDVYDIWKEELGDFNPVFYTGTEGTAAKNRAKSDFVEKKTSLFIISNRSGIGLDGLQHRCRTVVIGELDWSPQVHNQVIGRVDRDGQADQVTAYYLISEYGADPVMIDWLGLKSSQARGINDPLAPAGEQYSDQSRIKMLAESFLHKKKQNEQTNSGAH